MTRKTGQVRAIRVVHGGLLWLFVFSLAKAETLPFEGPTDSRIRSAVYSPTDVYRLHGHVGYHIDLEFSPEETVLDVTGGDLKALVYSSRANILTLKPGAASAAMSLIVSTTKRRYVFDYTATAKAPDRFQEPVMYTVRFIYAESEKKPQTVGLSPEEEVAAAFGRADRARPRNYDYWFCGRRGLKPLEAWDDGVHTWLRFSPRAEIPAIFVRNEDRSESLLNYSFEAGDVVIHRVARRFVLRRGRLTACVENRSYVGSGLRLDSGTVAPDVERLRKAGAL